MLCYVGRPGEQHPAALQAFKQGLDLSQILKEARPVRHKSITSFSSLRQDVYTHLAEADVVAGIKVSVGKK